MRSTRLASLRIRKQQRIGEMRSDPRATFEWILRNQSSLHDAALAAEAVHSRALPGPANEERPL